MQSLVDRWTLVHLAFWFVTGANYAWHGLSPLMAIIATVVGVYLWEAIELLLEKKELVTGSEDWKNRWVSDPLVGFVGAALGWWWVV